MGDRAVISRISRSRYLDAGLPGALASSARPGAEESSHGARVGASGGTPPRGGPAVCKPRYDRRAARRDLALGDVNLTEALIASGQDCKLDVLSPQGEPPLKLAFLTPAAERLGAIFAENLKIADPMSLLDASGRPPIRDRPKRSALVAASPWA